MQKLYDFSGARPKLQVRVGGKAGQPFIMSALCLQFAHCTGSGGVIIRLRVSEVCIVQIATPMEVYNSLIDFYTNILKRNGNDCMMNAFKSHT